LSQYTHLTDGQKDEQTELRQLHALKSKMKLFNITMIAEKN